MSGWELVGAVAGGFAWGAGISLVLMFFAYVDGNRPVPPIVIMLIMMMTIGFTVSVAAA